jgi:ketosteroid isomerase-like protein
MRSYLGAALLISFAFALLACASAIKQPEPQAEATKEADDMAALDRLRGEFIAMYNAGDASTLATLFTEDGLVMRPNALAANGRVEIHSFYRAHLVRFTGRLAVSSEEIEVAGEWAFERGAYANTLTPKTGGTPTVDEGKYLLISRRQPHASWTIARHIWNSDNPVPALRGFSPPSQILGRLSDRVGLPRRVTDLVRQTHPGGLCCMRRLLQSEVLLNRTC